MITSTGVVMAANPGCQVAMRFETLRASTAITRKVHHSAATLARWKIGATAWSKAHSGRVYRGHPPAQTAMGGKPSTYVCRDIALELSTIWPMLLSEPLPEFHAYTFSTPSADAPVLDLAVVSNASTERDQLLGGFYGLPSIGGASPSGGGGSPNGTVGSASLPPGATPAHSRPLAPEHPTEEVTLLPGPLPAPAIVPTPEPSAVILLATGVVALGVCKFRKQSAF